MSRILLISPNIASVPYAVYPLGMATVASALAKAGHKVRQFDFLASGKSEELLCSAVREFQPDFICLSLRNIDSGDSLDAGGGGHLGVARRAADAVRRVSSAPIILGGPAFSILPKDILAFIGAQYGIVGEGEKRLPLLIKAVEDGELCPEILNGAGPGLESAEMASPLLVPELVDYYMAESGMINIQTKRGCPFKCVYCTYPRLEGSRFRPRDCAAVVDDMERIKRDFGVDSFFFTDSIFNDPEGHYLTLAEELIRRDLGVRWCGFFRPQGLGRKELAILKRAGLYAVELGSDAASDAALAGLNKQFSIADVLQANQACIEEQIPCAHFVMFGGPGETHETVAEGLENLNKLDNCVVFAFLGIRIFPKTRLHNRAVAELLIDKDSNLLSPAYYFSPKLEPEKVEAMIVKSFHGRRDRIFPPSEGDERLAVMRRFGFKGILWDQLVSRKYKTPESAS